MFTPRRFAVYALLAGALSLAAASLAAEEQDIVIGQVASLTNPASADNARDLNLGYRVYFDYVNANGGVHGRKLKVLLKDDNLTAPKMVELTNELIADPAVIALAGFLNTGGLTEITKQDLLAKSAIALIAPSQGNKNIVGAENVFPFRSGYQEEVQSLIDECKNTQKKRIAIVHMKAAFGPPTAAFAEQAAKEAGLTVTNAIGYEVAPDKIEESLRQTVAAMEKSEPEAVILVGAGKGAFDFIKRMRASTATYTQIYGMSVLSMNDLIKTGGLDTAKGVILSQSVPYPYTGTLPVLREYLKLMKQYAPDGQVNFFSFEGFAGAKIIAEALKRAGPNPTRKKVIEALKAMGEYDLGGVSVAYTPKARLGWRGVDLTIIGSTGKLLR